MEKLIRKLEKNETIYDDLGMSNFVWYRYLCPLPLKKGKDCDKYFILIDGRFETPIRMYYTDFNKILEKNLNSLEDVKKRQIKLTEEHLTYLKNE